MTSSADAGCPNLTDALRGMVDYLVRIGVIRVFGSPGATAVSILPELGRAGIDVVWSHTQSGAVLMASTDAEVTGRPSVVLTPVGPPDVAGLWHCAVNRVPLLLLADEPPRSETGRRVPMLAGLVKAYFTTEGQHSVRVLRSALQHATDGVPGPVALELPRSPSDSRPAALPSAGPSITPQLIQADLRRDLADARRPLVLAGLGSRRLRPGALDAAASRLRAPVLTTARGKGAVDETGPWSAGILQPGNPLLERSDLLLTVGLDAAEQPDGVDEICVTRIELAEFSTAESQFARVVHGDLTAGIEQLPGSDASMWTTAEIAATRSVRPRAPANSDRGLPSWQSAQIISDRLSDRAEITVDAGPWANELTQRWQSRTPGQFWIADTTQSMGYALPAAIARSSMHRDSPVVCCTDDVGLLLAAGELVSVARLGHRLIIVRFDRPPTPASGPTTDWHQIAAGLNIAGTSVYHAAGLSAALDAALTRRTPSLISVRTID